MESLEDSRLPLEIKTKLAELEVELSEGDITEKGYQKKKQKLLAPFTNSSVNSTNPSINSHIPCGGILLPGFNETHHLNSRSPAVDCGDNVTEIQNNDSINAQNRRYICENHRYRSDIREEAVKEALVQARRERYDPLAPSKRRDPSRLSYIHQTHERDVQYSDDSDEDISSTTSAQISRLANTNQSTGLSEVPSSSMPANGISDTSRLRATTSTTGHLREQQSGVDRYDEVPSLDEIRSAQPPIRSSNRTDHSDVNNPWTYGNQPSSDQQNGNLDKELKTADSFEQLAALAEAQLNFHNLGMRNDHDPSINTIYHSSKENSTAYQPQAGVSSYPVSVTQNGQRSHVFGGVSVLPSFTSGGVSNGNSGYTNHELIASSSNYDLYQSQQEQYSQSNQPMSLASSSSADLENDNSRKFSSPAAASGSFGQDISSDANQTTSFVCHNRVSEKIQKLVNTLKRPKRYPLPEYFLDDEDQVLVRPVIDPTAPRPRGLPSEPLLGEELVIPSGLPRNLESALQRYASLSCKTPALTCLDVSGRPTQVLTYAKLLQRAIRIAYTLLNKLGHRGDQSLKPGDRVALVYANNEPISFLCAFYGCILASVIPISIEVPSARRDASCQSMGFLLGSQDARVVLASEQCYKALQRGPNGDILSFSGWPHVTWINTDHHASGTKPPKDWTPPDRLANDTTMYSEYTFSKDGSIHGVMISRRAALSHCRALTVACNYSEEDIVVCVVDCRRQMGLWHAVLTSVFNGLHVIFVPYSVMQIDPGSWLRMVTKYRATVAIVKSRDMHWALLAERDHPNVNLSSLRMLLVADGSNPWSLNSCDSFVQKFRSRGFCPEAICPSAGSSETLTLCLRRPPNQSNSAMNSVNGKMCPTSRSDSLVASAPSSVRGVISIHSLTYGVVRVDTEDSLTSLTLQDCGQVLPGASAVVVRLGPKPILCQTDEVGEICLSAEYTGSGYWGLRGQTDAYFNVEPIHEDGTPLCSSTGVKRYTRSGFLGFPGPASSGGLIFISGCIDGLMTIAGRRHNADDIIATVLAVQPTKIIYRGRIAVFSVDLLKDERLVIVAELRQGYSDEAAFTWMSLVLQAVDSIHQVSVYCLALTHQNTLPKTPFGGINCHSVKRLFSDGHLHPTALLLCPHSAIQNLPQPRQPRPSLVGPSAIMVGQVVQGVRLAEARGRPLGTSPSSNTTSGSSDNGFEMLIEILIHRANHTPDNRLFTVYNAKGQEASTLTCSQLLRRAERLAVQLKEKGKAQVGTIVALLYPPGTELVCAFYACLLIGAIPVPVRPPRIDSTFGSSSATGVSSGSSPIGLLSGPLGSGSSSGISLLGSGSGGAHNRNSPVSGSAGQLSSDTGSFPNMYFRPNAPSLDASLDLIWNVVKHSGATVIFTQNNLLKLLKSKEAVSRIPFSHWPTVLDSEEYNRRKSNVSIQVPCLDQPVAYLDFAASTTGTLTGIRVTHQVVYALCRAQKMQCEFYPTREVVLSLDPYSGLGFTLWALTSVYCGHHSVLVPPSVTESVPDLWLTICSQRKVRDAFCSNYTMELATRYLTKQVSILKQREISLSSIRSLVIVAEERPRIHLTATFTKLFASLGLTARAVSTSFGCRVNLAISLQGASSPESTTVYVDSVSLRNDRVKLLEKGSPHSLCLMESGKLLPGVHVAIANPDTLGQCADSQLGEIWVSSPHNSTELLGPFDSASLNRSTGVASQPVPGLNAADALHARLVTGDTERVYARTGFLGFVRRTELTQSDGELHDAIFVVGSLEETILLRGMRFHPIDIENTVMRSHKKICECAVFSWSNLLVVVAELAGEENEAMDLVHPITAHVLTEHQMIVGVVVVVDPRTVPINPSGEKQRILLRDSFVNDKLDPIYVSYNM
ncbi:Disco-interacting protein 2isoform 3 [Schistosoma japonicum]|uniref:Disco-interacting protein 2isoform 3 n=3 Tax=Schistosoma japonicum TaxID=6182 RepID=A0A4Z2CYF3_SCHJA|nr:Disco-interacting protein 2 like [Schistosoma japonicum]TNN09285.1 Disco-interacting protein 2isoform 3 [Schistosoma japonicum]